jgi:hypothetical protein
MPTSHHHLITHVGVRCSQAHDLPATYIRQKQFNRESSSSRSGDPAVNKLQSKAGSPLREDDDSHI